MSVLYKSCIFAFFPPSSTDVPTVATSTYSSLALEPVSSVPVCPLPPHNLGQCFAYLLFSSNVLLSPVKTAYRNQLPLDWNKFGIISRWEFLWSAFKIFFFPKVFTGYFCTDPVFIYIYTVVYSEVSDFSFAFSLYTVLSLKYLCSNLSQIPKGLLFVCFTVAW